MDVKIIPGLADTCALGMDFGEIFGIVMHLCDRQLWLADEPIIKFAFDREDVGTSDFCNGIALLEDTEKEQLEQFLKRIIPPQPEKLPPAKLVEHVINTQGHATIKQRNHRMSPKATEALITLAQDLIDQDLIEPSKSDWCNPVVMARMRIPFLS